MHVARIGLTPVKGGRHRSYGSVRLTTYGPVGDRAFCLVDPATDRCLRTVENPALLQVDCAWDGATLSAALPSGTVTGEPAPTGDVRTVDYWGRPTPVSVVAGPWSAAFSAHLGREVALAHAPPGAVVYGAAVTLVSTASVSRLGDALGTEVDAARFRATLELDGTDPYAERAWPGRVLRVGSAALLVRRRVARCAVVDLRPDTGERDVALLRALPRGPDGEPWFGVEADVLAPGGVTTGDSASLRAAAGCAVPH